MTETFRNFSIIFYLSIKNIMDFLPNVIGGEESDENEILPEVVKVDLNEDDVFDDEARKPSLKMKPVKDEDPILPESEDVGGLDVHEPEPVKKDEPVKKTRKKRVMSEEQKEKLAEARKKALTVRRANAQKKKEIKMLKQAKQDEELEDLRKSVKTKPKPKPVEQPVERPPTPKPVEQPKPKKEYIYTQDDMDKLTFRAIANYDEIRKVRKKEKAKKREEEQLKSRERQKLMSLVSKKSSYNSSDDFWGNCF